MKKRKVNSQRLHRTVSTPLRKHRLKHGRKKISARNRIYVHLENEVLGI